MLYVTAFAVTLYAGTDRKGTSNHKRLLLSLLLRRSIQASNSVAKVDFVYDAAVDIVARLVHFLYVEPIPLFGVSNFSY